MQGTAHLTDRQAQLAMWAIEEYLGDEIFSGQVLPKDRRQLQHVKRELQRVRDEILTRRMRAGLR